MNGKAVVAALVVGACVIGIVATSQKSGPLLATAVIVVGLLMAVAIVAGSWQVVITKKAQAELSGGNEYRGLAEEYRRLADMAITAQEHTDIKLGDVSAQLDYLREQMDSMQKILKEVE